MFQELFQTTKIKLNVNNWKEKLPYHPTVFVWTGWNEDGFYLRYEVVESHVLCVHTGVTGEVWKDSCVEFFVAPFNDNRYFNFECNAVGSCLIGFKNGGDLNKHATIFELQKIHIETSLPKYSYQDIKEDTFWSINVFIPKNIILSNMNFEDDFFVSNRNFKGNLYKCGNNTQQSHYISWTKINTPEPKFHSPSFFGEMKLL